MVLPVTALFAAIMGLWLVFLVIQVVGFRRREKVSLGTGDNVEGERLIRAHGNAAEAVPIFLIMMGLDEGLGAAAPFLYVTGVAFCIGRFLHGANFILPGNRMMMRVVGMSLTLVATIVVALDLLRHAVGL